MLYVEPLQGVLRTDNLTFNWGYDKPSSHCLIHRQLRAGEGWIWLQGREGHCILQTDSGSSYSRIPMGLSTCKELNKGWDEISLPTAAPDLKPITDICGAPSSLHPRWYHPHLEPLLDPDSCPQGLEPVCCIPIYHQSSAEGLQDVSGWMIRVPTVFLPAPLTSQQPHLLIRTNDSYSHADSSCLLVSDHKQPKVPKGS